MISELKEGEHLAEFYLGADDWLVLIADQSINEAQREAVAAEWQRVVSSPGRKVAVLQGGLRLQVIHVGQAIAGVQDTQQGG